MWTALQIFFLHSTSTFFSQEIFLIAVKLAEKVFEKCAAKLKPCLSQGTISLDDYTDVVTAVCVGCPPNENASTDPLVQKSAISTDADDNVFGPPNSMVVADESVSEPETALQFFCPEHLR